MEIKLCPCCSGKEYEDCCAPLIRGERTAETPEALMRSRYTAYSQAYIPYIQQTMKSPASDNYNAVEAKKWAESTEWLGLEVKSHHITDSRGTVEFIATYRLNNQKHVMHEVSEFRRDDGKWYYVNGKAPAKVSRNEPCPCGSGKKYKKCCA